MESDVILEMRTTVHAPASKVWEALTDPAMVKQYFFGTNLHTNWEQGGPISFKGTYEGKTYEDKGRVLDFIPEKLLRHTYWSSMSGIPDEEENYAIITYQLKKDGDDTDLTVRQENIPDEKTKTHAAQNWSKVLTALKDLLETEDITK